MDVFIHVPIDNHSEAFGLTYIESLAAQVPAIFTLSGVAPEFIENEKNALVVPFKDSETIYESLVRIHRDASLANRLKRQGANDVKRQFSFNLMMSRLNNLYASL
jgi:glycosyltransferase involved in cell wall biosynthesis